MLTGIEGKLSRRLAEDVEQGIVPGVAVTVANRDGTVLESYAGTRNTASGAPVSADTVFWIASLTKAVTTVAAMQLVERGLLSLDAPAATVLPQLENPSVLVGFEPDGRPILRAARGGITLRQLLSHTSGFTYFSWHSDTLRYEKWAGLPPLFSCKDSVLSMPLAADPGTEWHYGIGVDWAGKMVEAASGRRLEDFFRENIFEPLAMKDSGFILSPQMRSRLAAVHERDPEGLMHPIGMEVPQEPEFYMGGGGLYSTPNDFTRFMRIFLGQGAVDGVHILQPDTVAEMARNQIGSLEVRKLVATEPGGLDAEFFPGLPKKWGLGFMLNAGRAPTGRSAWSLAWAGSTNCYFWIDPARDVAGLMMMQYFPFADPAALRLFADFETMIYAGSNAGRLAPAHPSDN